MPRLLTFQPKKKKSALGKATQKKPMKSGSDLAKRRSAVLKVPKERNRAKEALRRLGVKPEELASVPDISSLLKQSQGGLKSALQAMRFSEDLSVIAFLEKYDEVPETDRKSLSWEAVALAADVDTTHLLGGTILAIQAYSSNAVKIIALSNHPKITAKRVEFGLLPGGERDRAALDTALGFLPTAKGSTFIINPAGVRERGGDDDDAPAEDDPKSRDLDHLFPSLKGTQEALVPARARMLESGS